MPKILSCRIQSCESTEIFADVEAVNESDWSELSRFSITVADGDKIRGYCPGHAKD